MLEAAKLPEATARIAAVIPCYRVSQKILGVLAAIPAIVTRIYVVDDACPEGTGALVTASTRDPRISVITHESNLGVGGAVLSGYRAAIAAHMDVIVKIDGDGQMNPALLPTFIAPILEGKADYTKGNRFFELESLRSMPAMRLFGNATLSLVNKLSAGYWDVMDPTNGYTAIHAKVAKRLPLGKIAKRYFFESDMLFRLGTLRAVVLDIPMAAIYLDESSSLRIRHVLFEFPGKYASRIIKRIFYTYFLRDFNAGTVGMVMGLAAVAFGTIWGAIHWILSVTSGVPATSGVVMIAALPILLGGHLLLSAINFDIANVPRICLHRMLD